MNDTGKRILDKLLSGRFLTTILFNGTFCTITIMAMAMFWANLDNEKTLPIVEKIAMFILGAFCSQVANVISSYFDRTDRNINGGNKTTGG